MVEFYLINNNIKLGEGEKLIIQKFKFNFDNKFMNYFDIKNFRNLFHSNLWKLTSIAVRNLTSSLEIKYYHNKKV